MGTGDMIFQLEQNLQKIWVLMHHNYFNIEPGSEEKKLLGLIESYFKEPIRRITLERISKFITHLKDTYNVDIIDIVKDYKLEQEDSGGAHRIITPSGTYVYPDP
jgi:hypothetical protein